MKRVSVTESYSVELPDDYESKYDDGISSFWRPGSETALQLSSHLRPEGGPLDARDRLEQHLARAGVSDAKPITVDSPSPSSAAAEFRDQSGYVWRYIYLVWSDLSIFATVSWVAGATEEETRWAMEVLRNLSRTYM